MNLGQGLVIGRIRGIAIRVHWSWLAVAALISWSLATGFFAEEFQWSVPKRWAWAIGCAVAFFVSVLLHELSHAFVAQRYAMKVPSITLFIFGGVSNIEGEMKTPGQEFRVAIAGPGDHARRGRKRHESRCRQGGALPRLRERNARAVQPAARIPPRWWPGVPLGGVGAHR